MYVQTDWGMIISGITRGYVDSLVHYHGGARKPTRCHFGFTGYLGRRSERQFGLSTGQPPRRCEEGMVRNMAIMGVQTEWSMTD